jgi:hypothetical protein
MILPRRLYVAPLLLALFLAGGSLAAATGEHQAREVRQPQHSVTGLLSEAWALVSWIWEREGHLIAPFEKEGGSGDPFGNPKPNAQPPGGSTSAESQPASGT